MTEEKVSLATYGQYIRQKIADRSSFVIRLQLSVPFDRHTLPLQLVVEGADGTYVIHPFTNQSDEKTNLKILETICDDTTACHELEKQLSALALPFIHEIFLDALTQAQLPMGELTHHQAGRA